MKRVVGISLVVVIAAVTAAALAGYGGTSDDESEANQQHDDSKTAHVDVVMPTKVSRPGCEEEDRCYVPSTISVRAGESVSWLNNDAAFHSVTSGAYGAPTDLFDSGYMDPGDIFSHTFAEPGKYDYYCTLHEWMYGTVFVNHTGTHESYT